MSNAEQTYIGVSYGPSGIINGAGAYFNGTEVENEIASVSFEIIRSTFVGGRRGVMHQYPYKDSPYFEDFGNKARVFEMQIQVWGDDHVDQTNRLITQFDTEGIGTLIHPQRGRWAVYPTEYRVTDSDAHIGLTEISLTFVQAGEFAFPGSRDVINPLNVRFTTAQQLARIIENDINALTEIELDRIEQRIGIDPLNDFISGLNSEDIAIYRRNKLAEVLRNEQIRTSLANPSFENNFSNNSLSDIESAIKTLKDSVIDLANTPISINPDFVSYLAGNIVDLSKNFSPSRPEILELRELLTTEFSSITQQILNNGPPTEQRSRNLETIRNARTIILQELETKLPETGVFVTLTVNGNPAIVTSSEFNQDFEDFYSINEEAYPHPLFPNTQPITLQPF